MVVSEYFLVIEAVRFVPRVHDVRERCSGIHQSILERCRAAVCAGLQDRIQLASLCENLEEGNQRPLSEVGIATAVRDHSSGRMYIVTT
jgi:hypothetical protein